MLAEVENIDDDADSAGINFVKIDDKMMAKELGVFALPAILFFKSGSKEPVIYAGDLYDEQLILSWLLTQKDPSGDIIEDTEGSELITLIDKEEALAVYFCKYRCGYDQLTALMKANKYKSAFDVSMQGTRHFAICAKKFSTPVGRVKNRRRRKKMFKVTVLFPVVFRCNVSYPREEYLHTWTKQDSIIFFLIYVVCYRSVCHFLSYSSLI